MSSVEQQTAAPSRRQTKVGRVVSDKMQKTIVVTVDSMKPHPIYKKKYRQTNRYKAHDEENTARIGDLVLIEESRPLSKDKRWRLVEIVQRADSAPTVAEVATADVPAEELGKVEEAEESDDEEEED
jgi:small subunit ribosomal protein S17